MRSLLIGSLVPVCVVRLTASADDESVGDKALRGIGWVVVERWGSRIVTLVVFTLLARLLSPADFGLLSLATVVTAILQVFVDSSFNRVLVQRAKLGAKDASTIFWTSNLIAVALYAIVFFAAPILAVLLGDARLVDILRVQSLAIPIAALSSTPAALLERDFKFKALSIRRVAGTVVGAVVAVSLAFAGAGVWALVGQTLAQSIVGLILLWAASHWRPKLEFSLAALRSMADVGFSVLGVGLLNAVQSNIDKLIIGVAIDPTALGYYFLAQRILNIVSELVTSVVAQVSFTTFSRVQGDVRRVNVAMRGLTFASASVAIPVFAILALLAPYFIPVVFGDDWIAAVPVFQLLTPSIILASITYFDGNLLIAVGKARSAFGIALAQNIVGIALLVLAVPYGINAVALSRSVRVIVLWPLRLVLLAKQASIAIKPYMRQLMSCAIAVLPVITLLLLLGLTPWAGVANSFFLYAIPVGVIGILLYIAVLWPIAGDEQRGTIRRVAQKVQRRRGPKQKPEAEED